MVEGQCSEVFSPFGDHSCMEKFEEECCKHIWVSPQRAATGGAKSIADVKPSTTLAFTPS
eukprot:4617658-Amphidinium_carterae.1